MFTYKLVWQEPHKLTFFKDLQEVMELINHKNAKLVTLEACVNHALLEPLNTISHMVSVFHALTNQKILTILILELEPKTVHMSATLTLIHTESTQTALLQRNCSFKKLVVNTQ
jgi:light-regulated signal transduction histidine kinase (bacteriophytochrome)